MKKTLFIKRKLIVGLAVLFIILILLGHSKIGNNYIIPKDLSGGFIGLDGEQIRFIQQGEGQDILFVHGTPGCIEDWSLLMDSLSVRYRVTAFDRLGQGYSTCKNYKYNIHDNARLVKKLIKELELDSPLLIGHSYGGSIIAHLTDNHYDDDLKYIIIDSPLYDYDARIPSRLLTFPLVGKGIGWIANYTFASNQMKSGIEASFVNQSPHNLDKLVAERLQIWGQPKVLYANAKETMNYQKDLDDISDKYKSIDCDLTIITGVDQSKTFKEQCERMSLEVQSDTLIILENTGHYVQFDRSEEVLEIIHSKMN